MKHDLIKNGSEYIGNGLSPYPNSQEPSFKEKLLSKILDLILTELISRGINELIQLIISYWN